MKKSLLALVLMLGLFSTGRTQVLITEIMYNPPESGTDSLEYIELYNNTNQSVDVSGWNFTQGFEYVFPAGTSMNGHSYYVLAKNANAFQSIFGFAPNAIFTSGALTNSPGEDIELRDAGANVIDYVDYMNAAPWPLEANGMGSALVLCDFNTDNSLAGSWQAASTGTGKTINGFEVKGNPNAASGCSGPTLIKANDDNLTAPTGQATQLSVQTNDVIVNALTSFTVTAAPQHGTATVAGNQIRYTSNAGYCGPDEFKYQICDAVGCSEATVKLTVKCYTPATIDVVTGEDNIGLADSLNANVELEGVVYGVNLRPINNSQPALLFTIIDGSFTGIAVSSLGGNYGYTVKEKDRVKVRGTIGQFNGQTEIRPDTIILVSSNNSLVSPTEVNFLGESTESKLVWLKQLSLVDPAEWTTGTGSSGFNVRAISPFSTDTFLIRIDRDVETFYASVPNQPFDLVGIGGQFDATSPYFSGYQVLPRYNPDISSLVRTSEADFSADVMVSPNPATRLLSIEMKTTFDKVVLLNTHGQEIKQYLEPGDHQKVDVTLMQPGIYFLRFEKGGKAWTTRFVKQ